MADLGNFTGSLISKNTHLSVNLPTFNHNINRSVIDCRDTLPLCYKNTYHKQLTFENLEQLNYVDKYSTIFIHDDYDNLTQVNSNLFSMTDTGGAYTIYLKENINKITVLSYDFRWSSVLTADINNTDIVISIDPQTVDINGNLLLNGKAFTLYNSFIKIDNEIMRVTDVTAINVGSITVERAQKDTTAVAHLTGANVVKEYTNAVAIASINLNTLSDPI